MKLFENMEEMGATIHEILQHIINDIYKDDVDDDVLDELVNNLSLSDLLDIDSAYEANNKSEIKIILDPLLKLDEYSMGGGRQATSAASKRPQPGNGQTAQKQTKSSNAQTTQPASNYSGGVQNGVSTTNIDNEDEPEMKQEEPIEETQSNESFSHALIIDFPSARLAKRFSGNALQGKGFVIDRSLIMIIGKDIGTDTTDVAEWAAEEYEGSNDRIVKLPNNSSTNESSIEEDTSKFAYGDPVIDDQGNTGEIYGSEENGQIQVSYYNGGIDFVDVNRLEINDYADSEQEEYNLRLQYGDDEYDRLNGNLGYKDDDMYESTKEYISPKEVKSLMNKHNYFYSGDKDKNGWLEYSTNNGDAYWMSWPDNAWKNTSGKSGSFDDGSLIASFNSNIAEMTKWLQHRAGIK